MVKAPTEAFVRPAMSTKLFAERRRVSLHILENSNRALRAFSQAVKEKEPSTRSGSTWCVLQGVLFWGWVGSVSSKVHTLQTFGSFSADVKDGTLRPR